MSIENSGDSRSLIESIRSGDGDSFAELVRLYTPMIHSLAGKLGVEIADCFSDACFALYKAAFSYDLSNTEVTFGLYAKVCVRNRIMDIRRKSSASVGTVSDLDVENIAVDSGIVSRLEREEERREFHLRAHSLLSSFEYSVLLLWLSDFTTADIAHRLSKSSKSVDNAKARILKKLRGGITRSN